MNFEWAMTVLRWIISAIPYVPKAVDAVKQVADLGKETLDIAKTGVGVFESAKGLIEKDAAEHPEQTVDRVHAMADLTKSLAPLAFAEVVFYAVKVGALLLIFKWATGYLTKRLSAKRDQGA